MSVLLKRIEVPTGDIFIVRGDKGKLECLSLGDYGKAVNLNQHHRVDHTNMLPLSEKWVCTISTQYGCSMGCTFCDVPKVGPGINASFKDIMLQVKTVLSLHPEIRSCSRFNIHYARMGEPTFNQDVITSAMNFITSIPGFTVHPVVSTMMPKNNKNLRSFLNTWVWTKNVLYQGEAGLQLSINSTSDTQRNVMFSGNAMGLQDISWLMAELPAPKGRKYTLNFAIADYSIDAEKLVQWFSPDRFICKLTPMHKTRSALSHGIQTSGDYTESYPYEEIEHNLQKAGFETLVFIASKEEDESRITCGNAILSDKLP